MRRDGTMRKILPGCLALGLALPGGPLLPLLSDAIAQPQSQADVAPPIHVSGYGIDVALDPSLHRMTAKTTVAWTALKDAATVSFHLNPALQVTTVTDEAGHVLRAERLQPAGSSASESVATPRQDLVRITPAAAVRAGQSMQWTFAYSGVLDGGAHDGGAQAKIAGGSLAAIADPISYLLDAAEWFPMAGDGTDRFTAAIRVRVPVGERVLGSGLQGAPHADANGRTVFDFRWSKPGFPGTILAGKFLEPFADPTASNIRVYVTKAHQADGQQFASTAAREYAFFTSLFGPADSNQLNIVELPGGAVPAYAAPEIAAIAGAQMRGPDAFRLLANTMAHQWWGNLVSPASRGDAWITNGMARDAELLYLAKVSDAATLASAVLDVSAGALLYDSVPLADAGRYPQFSPEFESMTYDKGGMIFRMLQWQLGDAAFQRTLRALLSRYAENSVSAADVERVAEAQSGENLQPFFTQWLHNTGAPTLQDQWTIYRLGNNAGFRTLGEIDEDLDLFQMPVEVRVETDGKTADQRVQVEGAHSQFAIDTFGMPRKVTLDPQNWLLKNSPDMQVRVHILRGQQLAARGDFAAAVEQYRQALAINPIRSLASYRLGDAYQAQRNYQAAASAYRDALRGDDRPKWIEVWSDLQLGKILDASGQRERAVNQYQEALQTNDNTGGALDLAREYIQHPYQPSRQ